MRGRNCLGGPVGSTNMRETEEARPERKGTRSSLLFAPVWRQEVREIHPILSTQSYQVVNLSFDLVNNVEGWRQLPPPSSAGPPFPHKTSMKPAINRPDKEEGSRFQKSAAPQKMPFSASKVPLFEEQTRSTHSPGHKVSEQRVSLTLRLAELVWSVAHIQKPPPLLPFLKFFRDMGTGGQQDKGQDQSDNKNSVQEKSESFDATK